ncbi:META domain-containing protein [Streptomyces sp. NPDC047002]|uniref:META domain-containing protein n=1 Tax=Streptomyces sp. NPDC047002 TaxID=3155475 RepID=UPI003451C5E8
MDRPRDMQKQQIASAGVAALLALTAACGTQSATEDPGQAASSSGPVRTNLPLAGVRWKVDSLTVDGAKPAVPAAATVEIGHDGALTVGTGCNGYHGRARVDGAKVTVVSGLNRTFMGCSMYLEQYEEAIGKALKKPLTAQVSGGSADDRQLVLTSESGSGTRVALTTRPAAPLVGTDWKVDALTGPRSSTGLPKDAAGRAHLVIGKDGTVSGSLGCNAFHATARVEGSKVTFGAVTSTKMACSPATTKVEKAMLAVVRGTARAQVSHRSLYLAGQDGTGLAAARGRAAH